MRILLMGIFIVSSALVLTNTSNAAQECIAKCMDNYGGYGLSHTSNYECVVSSSDSIIQTKKTTYRQLDYRKNIDFLVINADLLFAAYKRVNKKILRTLQDQNKCSSAQFCFGEACKVISQKTTTECLDFFGSWRCDETLDW